MIEINKPNMFPHIAFIGCSPDHEICDEKTCDNERLASDYWEQKRLEAITQRELEARMAPMMAQSAN